MQEPATKQQLLEQLQREQTAWNALLDEIGHDRMEIPGVTGDWSMKDTIIHLTAWWRRELALLASAQRGERPPEHPPQSLVPIINEWMHRINRDRPLAHILRDAQDVWQQFAEKLQELPEDVLLDRKRFAWMEGHALGPSIFANFTNHLHEEHEPLIRSWLRQWKKA